MTEEGKEEKIEVLAEQWLGRSNLLVQIDRGFQKGTYGVVVQFDERAAREGFALAHRKAQEYCAFLKEQLGRVPGYKVGRIDDPSRQGGERREHDLETTFLAFPLIADDRRFHDAAVQEAFRLALLRAGQVSDQEEARAQTLRRDRRVEEFRGRLARLLEGGAYAGLDLATRNRLLEEIPALAFPARGREL